MKFNKLFLVFLLSLFLSGFASAQKVMIFRTSSADSITVVNELKKELLKMKYDLVVKEYDKSSNYSWFESSIKGNSVGLMIVLDNKAIEWAKKYNDANKKKVPGIALMGLNLKSVLKGRSHLAGIAYETPAYSLATKFASAIKDPLEEIVVFYRKSIFQDRINEARSQLKVAKMKLKAIDVEGDVKSLLDKNLKQIVAEEKKGRAIWVMLDSAILTREIFTKTWLPFAAKNEVPIITETKKLAQPAFNFCVFATTPNLVQLANQASQMVRFILKNGIKPMDIGVENLIAVEAYMNAKKASALGISIKDSAEFSVKMLK